MQIGELQHWPRMALSRMSGDLMITSLPQIYRLSLFSFRRVTKVVEYIHSSVCFFCLETFKSQSGDFYIQNL